MVDRKSLDGFHLFRCEQLKQLATRFRMDRALVRGNQLELKEESPLVLSEGHGCVLTLG